MLVTPLGLWTAWSFDFRGRRRQASGSVCCSTALAASMDGVAMDDRAQARPGRQGRSVFTNLSAADLGLVGIVFLGERFASAAWSRSPAPSPACCWRQPSRPQPPPANRPLRK